MPYPPSPLGHLLTCSFLHPSLSLRVACTSLEGGDRASTASLRTWRGAGGGWKVGGKGCVGRRQSRHHITPHLEGGREGGRGGGRGCGGVGDPVPNHEHGCPLRLVSTMREGGLDQELHHMRSYSI